MDNSGSGVMTGPQAAVKFLEWLSSETAQNLFADSNMEYPVNPNVKPAPEVQAWGDFKGNTDNISHSGVNQKAAIELMQKVGYK